MTKTLIVGVAPRAEIWKRAKEIAGGVGKRNAEPDLWVTSLESLAKILSRRNQLLLELIRDEKPKSLAELARKSGRAASNLSRTLHSMERIGIIEFVEKDGGRKVPIVLYDAIRVEGPIGGGSHRRAA